MGSRHCAKCGEDYSDTYKRCPFCEEEAALRSGHPLRRKGGKRLEGGRQSSGGAGGVMLLVAAVVILGVLGYVFFGDRVEDFMGIRDTDPEPVSAPGETKIPTAQTPPDQTIEPPPLSQEPAAPVEEGPLALSRADITIAAGETARLTASGGTGEVTWSTSNENIAAVEGGSVTGKAGGTATITATSGEESVSCTVTVTGDPWVSSANLSLNKTDFTFGSGDTPVTLRVKGTESPVTWTSANPGVAAVSAEGVVTWAGRGTTTVTAAVDGQTLECIVRAK